MLIDPKTPICGIRPSKLKRLLRLETIDASAAASLLGLSAEAAQTALQDLTADGWLASDRADGFWKATDLGHRLAATPLIKRFAAGEGRDIVCGVVERAQAINADPSYFFVVSKLVLFGSILTAKAEDEVGDVDVALECANRLPPGRASDALWDRELAGALGGYRGLREVYWPGARVRRVLKGRQRRISLHEMTDANAMSRRAIIYRFSAKTGAEQVFLPWNEA